MPMLVTLGITRTLAFIHRLGLNYWFFGPRLRLSIGSAQSEPGNFRVSKITTAELFLATRATFRESLRVKLSEGP